MKTFEIIKPNKFIDSAIFYQETGCSLFMLNGSLFISGCETQEEADNLIENHNPSFLSQE